MNKDDLKKEWLKRRGNDESFNLSFEVFEKVYGKSDFITKASMIHSKPIFIDDIHLDHIDLAITHLRAFKESKERSYLNTAQFYIKKFIENG